MKSRVRYLTISRLAFEMTTQLSPEDSSQFNKIIFSCFQQLENGEEMIIPETDSPFLNMALREAAGELETGYRNYMQKVTAKQKGSADQPDPDSESAIDQRSISDQSEIDKRREEKRTELIINDLKESSESSEGEGMQGGRPLSESELQSINSALSYAGISPDNQFYSYAKKVGCRITVDSIRKARDERSRSIAYVVKLMREAAEGGRL